MTNVAPSVSERSSPTIAATPRVAVVGAGNWGMNLVRTFHELRALAAVVEVDATRRSLVADRFPEVPVYPDPSKVWEAPIQAVVVGTPVPTHYELARQALLAGKDVFVEKPLTLSVEQAEELVDLARKRGQTLMVGHLLLYQPAIRWIRGAISGGLIGRLVSLHQERLNLGRARSAENALWSLGVHDVAVFLDIVGHSPESVKAVGQRVLQPSIDDDVYLHLQFPDGIEAHLHVSWLWPEKCRTLTIVGSEAMLVYDELAQTVTLHRKHISPSLDQMDEGVEVVYRGDAQPLRLECEHFLEVVATRESPRSDGRSGVAVLRVLSEAQRQLEAGR